MPFTHTGIATTADRSSAVVATIYGKCNGLFVYSAG